MAAEGPLKPDENVVIDGTDRLREGAKVELIAADPKQRAGAGAAAGSRRPAAAAPTPGEHPRSMDRLSPEQAEKVKAMSPDERRAWFRAQREGRDNPPSP